MTKANTDGDDDAFPSEYESGLSKREYFAAMALQGICAADTGNRESSPKLAEWALAAADALIAALNKEPANAAPC